MKITIDKETEYLPTWNGNRAAEDKFKAVLRPLTVSERDECMVVETVGAKMSIKPDMKKMFRFGLVRLENLELNGAKIITAQDVFDSPGLHDLYAELAAVILKLGGIVDKKNSR